MSLEKDLTTWANGRPSWQKRLLQHLCSTGPPDQTQIRAIADELVKGGGSSVPDLKESQIPGGQSSGDPVRLARLTKPTNINALAQDQSLEFGRPNGLTVVYGDNASGKSGYARVIKAVVRARHREAVLGNVFSASGSDEQNAEIAYEVGSDERTADWPADTPPELARMHFYDEACGDTYIGGESELTYQPSALTLLDRLIKACDQVRAEIDERLRDNDTRRAALPAISGPSAASSFLAGLSNKTTQAELDVASKLPTNGTEERARLIQEEARLRATDPTKERQRLQQHADALEGLANHIDMLTESVSPEGLGRLDKLRKDAADLRAAAGVASSKTFDDEPLKGVGSNAWRALWQAARAYSQQEAYHEHQFPVTKGADARCVLCQQTLREDSAARLERFEAFMADETERRADDAEHKLTEAVTELRALVTCPPTVTSWLHAIESAQPDLTAQSKTWLDAAASRQAAALQRDAAPGDPVDLPAPPSGALRSSATELRTAAAAVSDPTFAAQLDRVVTQKREVEGRITLAEKRGLAEAEMTRLKERAALEAAKQATDTGPITRKATQLTREHVTKLVRDQFTRESDRLALQKITLADIRGQKGQLRHRPALLGAEDSVSVTEVLSEGEQTALGLAGYFTEAYFDVSGSGLVLDDPVTSLDHIRRARAAKRLAEFATGRQVTVFTHDVTFVGDLRKAAEGTGAAFVERGVQRKGDLPGICVDTHPWKARDVKARLNELERLLAEIKRDRVGWTQDEYEEKVSAWAGKLSQTWERTISIEVVNQVVDRGTQEVRPKMFRVLARVTDQDDLEFQQSYGRVSQWAPRHDKSEETNYVAPEPADLEAELELVREWFQRVTKYRSN